MILAAFVFPHPPIILPEIGKGREREIQATIDAFDECAKIIADLKPDTIVVCSPHKDSKPDHGTTVPMYFVDKFYNGYELYSVGFAGYSLQDNFDFGKELAEHFGGKRMVFIASGDLSHALKADAPCGFSEQGKPYDDEICACLASCDFARLMRITPVQIEDAKECGIRSVAMMAGVLDGLRITPKLHSYEGTFGVGYAVASFVTEESEYVKLARYSLENFVKTGTTAELPANISDELLNNKAGVFVCIKKHGELRGCIGTIAPVTESVAHEVLRNAVSTCNEDPRFPPVTADELPDLVYTVDVLSPPEPIDSPHRLDVKKYGVIVTSGYKRGLLLPNLDGVDTIEQQLDIAKQKAGISGNDAVELQRFEVKRYV